MKKHLLLITLMLAITAAIFAQGNCLDFDGTDDIVIVPDYPKANTLTVDGTLLNHQGTDEPFDGSGNVTVNSGGALTLD